MPKKSTNAKVHKTLGVLRIALGAIFLWPFFDKLFGLGFSTCRDSETGVVSTMCDAAWASGGSPTSGFLEHATSGPLSGFYQSIAGSGVVDAVFMVGLLLIGLALVLGIGVKVAAISGSLMMLMMWSAVLLPANNPLLDDHLIYIGILLVIMFANQDQRYGLRSWWVKQSIVKRYPGLE